MKKVILSNELKVAIALRICKTAFAVINKCSENAQTIDRMKKFDEMRREGAILAQELKTGKMTDKPKTGDFLQMVVTGYNEAIKLLTQDKRNYVNFNIYDWMTEKRNVKTIDKRVTIKQKGTKAEKIVKLSAAQIIARKIRNIIESEGSAKGDNLKAVYYDAYEGKSFDSITAKEHLYIPFPYAMTETTNENERDTMTDICKLIKEIGLTPTQEEILNLRLKNFGIMSIGTYRGTSKQAVAKSLAQIGVKMQKYLQLSNTDIIALQLNEIIEQMTVDKPKTDLKKSPYYAKTPEGLKEYRENMKLYKEMNKK